jgi:hypothetical protein
VAAPIDRASDHVAVRAFDRYLHAALASLPAARRADERFIASISARCRGALAPLASRPATPASKNAAKALAAETVFDLIVTANEPLRSPLARFTGTVLGLRWSSARTASVIAAYPAAAHRLLVLGPSDLCADARAFVANSNVVPAGTGRWEARFARDSKATGKTAFAFGEVMGFFHGPRDTRVLKEIGRLSNRLAPAEKSLATAEETRLLNALGLHG